MTQSIFKNSLDNHLSPGVLFKKSLENSGWGRDGMVNVQELAPGEEAMKTTTALRRGVATEPDRPPAENGATP
jgi:hypothetical protein